MIKCGECGIAIEEGEEFPVIDDRVCLCNICITGKYDANEDREEYINRMIEEGYAIVLPFANELQIDMDTEEHHQMFLKQIVSLEKEYPEISYKVAPSRNGLPGRHATITMPFSMDDLERIAWQSVLGSDPFREFMSMVRLKRGDIHPTLFVENKKI